MEFISILKKRYQGEISSFLQDKLGLVNVHQVPCLEKVVINTGLSAAADKQHIEQLQKDVASICGQKPVLTRAKDSISNFKVRKGMPLGVKVTLRGDRMYDFVYRTISVALPRIRDFRGLSTRLDGSGNYTLGVRDHSIFPEINIDGNKNVLGMDITFVTSTRKDSEGLVLLRALGMPFRQQ